MLKELTMRDDAVPSQDLMKSRNLLRGQRLTDISRCSVLNISADVCVWTFLPSSPARGREEADEERTRGHTLELWRTLHSPL